MRMLIDAPLLLECVVFDKEEGESLSTGYIGFYI
jgi:hypothetical protein